MRRTLFALLGALLAACQAAPVPSGTAQPSGPTRVASAPPFVSLTAPLAHEGGIVFLKPLEDIADQARQSAAAALGIELTTQLRAERAMRDAGLLAAGTTTSATYTLMDKGPGGGSPGPSSSPSSNSGPSANSGSSWQGYTAPELPGSPAPSSAAIAPAASASPPAGSGAPRPGAPPPPPLPPDPWFADESHSGPGGEPRALVHEEERHEADDARTAWMGLTPDQRRHAEGLHDDRDRLLRDHHGPQLIRKAATFQRATTDLTAVPSVGGKTITSTFHVGNGGGLTLTVTRTFDAAGSLVQAVETMVGSMNGTGYNCERARTLLPDGTEVVAMDMALTIDGKQHTVRWAKQVSAEGRPSGAGSILRPDGTTVDLTSTGADALSETIAGNDKTAGVSLTLLANAAESLALATLDAGQAGSAQLRIDVDQLLPN